MPLPSSELEYWDGSEWIKEDNLITLSITDRLQEPLMLEAMIGNFSDVALNTREAIYTDFLKIRVKEKYSYKYIFYGKVSRSRPDRDNTWGHVVNIVALDNLRELSNLRLDEDITGQTTRSGLISNMITNHVWVQDGVPNVGVADSTKFLTSTSSEASSILDKTFKGDRKSILDIMQEVSKEDPTGHFFGYDFYLDAEFNGNTATPDLFYFPRGSIPTGTMPASGLTLKFNSLESNQVIPIMGDYTFPRISSELITRTHVRWVDVNDKPRKTETILINHGATSGSGGNFDIDDIITWSGGGSAKVYLVGTNNRWVSIGPDSVDVDDVEANANWLRVISGLTISSTTSGSVSATVNSATASPPGSLRESIEQDAEVVAQAYDASSAKSANVRSASILYSSGDSIVRGDIKILKYPQYVITGTHTGSNDAGTLTDSSKTFTNLGIFKSDVIKNTTDGSQATITSVGGTTISGSLSGGTGNDWDAGDTYEISIPVRAGQRVYVEDIPSGSNVTNQDCLVTSINYTEGPGIQISAIKLLLHSGGRGSTVPQNSKQIVKGIETAAAVPSNDQSGIKTRSSLGWTSTILFSPDGTNGHNTVDWASGSIFFFDGSDFSISSGTTGAISAVTYIYFSKDSPTVLQSTTNANTAKGPDNIVLATCENVASGGTVTIETTTGVAQKNYYSMDTLFDGAQYGRIQAGNLLSGWLNLGAANNAGVLDLDKTAESSTKKHVTGDQRDGGGRAFAGLTSSGFLTREHILNDVGLSFRSSSSSSYVGITGNGIIGIGGGANQFQIQATNGAAGFGGQVSGVYKVVANSDGLTLGTGTTGGGSGTGFLNFKGETSGYGTYKITNYNGVLQLFPGQYSMLRPNNQGQWKLGDTTFYWGNIYNATYQVHRTGSSFSTLTSNSGGDLLWNGSAISGGVTDHGALGGLSDQDHSAYSLTSHGHVNVYAPYAHVADSNAHHTPTTNTWRPVFSTSHSTDTVNSISRKGLYDHEATTHGGGGHTHSSSYSFNGNTVNFGTMTAGSTTVSSFTTNGSLRMASISGNVGTDIVISSAGYFYKKSSSKRFKENIIDLNFDSSPLYDLKPHNFKWKDVSHIIDGETVIDPGGQDFGYIAEEVHEILPQLVRLEDFEDGDNLPASVRYDQITVLLVEEMKKLKDRIEVLEGA